MMIACGRIAIVPVVDVVVAVQVDEPENLEQTEINHNHVISNHMIMVDFRFFPLAQPRCDELGLWDKEYQRFGFGTLRGT